jgi:hypothetical protein
VSLMCRILRRLSGIWFGRGALVKETAIKKASNPVPIGPPRNRHAAQQALEQYAFGQLVDSELQLIEEHLLMCEYCRGVLDNVDEEIRVLREALRLSELESRKQAAKMSGGGNLFVMKAGR